MSEPRRGVCGNPLERGRRQIALIAFLRGLPSAPRAEARAGMRQTT
jgi:hypothetical protein